MTPAAPGPLPANRSRDELVEEVRRASAAVPHEAAVVVAVSGGPDSTAMAHLLQEARPDLDLHLGHVRHGLRDDEADVSGVRRLGGVLGLEVLVAEVEVDDGERGLEAAARTARYAALRRLCRRVGSGWLFVGHTADDQAETLLMRMARGTGITGLGGMAPVRGDLVRPLLRIRRADIRRFVALEGLDVVHDPMNADRRFRRVRARHEVLPFLERLAPDPVGALARLADLARTDARHLDEVAGDAAAAAVRRYGPGLAVPADLLGSLESAIARRLVRRMIDELGMDLPVDAAHVVAVLSLEPGQAVDLPGVTATSGGGWVALVPADVAEPAPVPLRVPGRTRWRAGDVTVVAAVADGDADGQLALPLDVPWRPPDVDVPEAAVPPGGDPDHAQIVLGPSTVARRLEVRSRRPGDRVATHGGTRKVQDVLVDAGVPRALRDAVPVVASGDVVLWVPGVVADADALDEGRRRPALHLAVVAAGRAD